MVRCVLENSSLSNKRHEFSDDLLSDTLPDLLDILQLQRGDDTHTAQLLVTDGLCSDAMIHVAAHFNGTTLVQSLLPHIFVWC